MRPDDGFLEWLRELLEPNGRVAFKRMFGGHGLYLDGLFVAIVVDGRPYFKADSESAPAFVAAGCAPFVYDSGGKRVEMSYWSLPESALDSPEDMQPWARRAIAAALRKPAVAAAKKAAKKTTTRVRSVPSASTPNSTRLR